MYKHFFKRFFDFWISLIALICISPILLVVTIWLHFANKGAGAFFFDNLMMMLHYAYSCAYYSERMSVYCGKRLASSEKKMAEQMVRFILNGLGYKE